MKKKYLGLGVFMFTSLLALAACSSANNEEEKKEIDTTQYIFSDDYDYYDDEDDTFKIELANAGVGSYIQNENIYTITSGGEYNLSGVLPDGIIYVDSNDITTPIVINLNGCTITSKTNSPIYILNSESDVEISAKNGTENTIIDRRTTLDENDESQGSSAIYSTVDLSIKGKGKLNVVGAVNNGIHSKDDLKIKNNNINVKAVNNAIKGNDSVKLENLTGDIISIAGDGIKTTASDLSSTNKQRGNVTITGNSSLNIYACCDGIDAAYNTIIEADEDGIEPTINIYTNTYSEYSVEGAGNLESSTTMYLSLSSGLYNSSYYYYAYCYNVDDSGTKTGEFVKLSYYSSVQAGGRPGQQSVTNYLTGDIDTSKYKNIQFYIFTSDNPSVDDYYAASTGQTINSTKNMFQVSSITASSKKIGGDWSSYSTTQQQGGMGPGGMMDQGNTDKTEYSTKGIKADNEINISAGTINIQSYDDALHANSGVSLENGSTSTGNVNISGGDLTITSKDDGIHSEGTAELSGGKINILTAYEGIESPTINCSGSIINVYATDDGLNAGGSSGKINVSAGFVYANVASVNARTASEVTGRSLSSLGRAARASCTASMRFSFSRRFSDSLARYIA